MRISAYVCAAVVSTFAAIECTYADTYDYGKSAEEIQPRSDTYDMSSWPGRIGNVIPVKTSGIYPGQVTIPYYDPYGRKEVPHVYDPTGIYDRGTHISYYDPTAVYGRQPYYEPNWLRRGYLTPDSYPRPIDLTQAYPSST